jgi:hypothetical protein
MVDLFGAATADSPAAYFFNLFGGAHLRKAPPASATTTSISSSVTWSRLRMRVPSGRYTAEVPLR